MTAGAAVRAATATESTHGPEGPRGSWTARPFQPPREVRTVSVMTSLATTARRDGAGEVLLTGGLLMLYVGLRGTGRALAALESVVR